MLDARTNHHTAVDHATTVSADDLHLAAPKASAISNTAPQRPSRRCRPRPALDLPLATRQHLHTSKAHTDLGVVAETKKARSHRAVATTPAARLAWGLKPIGTHCSHRHAAKSRTVAAEHSVDLRLERQKVLYTDPQVSVLARAPVWSLSPDFPEAS